jgi:hypothetical protein
MPKINGRRLWIIMGEGKNSPQNYFPNSKEIINNYDTDVYRENPSAFRAVNNTANQTVTADNPVNPVLYPDVMFDVNREYDPVTSTFTPKQNGVYSIIASVNFIPNVIPSSYRVLVEIYVNGSPIASDNDFFGEIVIGDVTSVSAILQLAGGDKVNISALVSTNGIINANPTATHFEAARFPSPLVSCPSDSITPRQNDLSVKEV